MKTTGTHLLLEYEGCDAVRLDDAAHLEAALRSVADAAGATVVASMLHPFSPRGVSGVLVLAESHISIHTWPEERYCAVDFYTCGEAHPERADAILRDALGAERSERMEIARGARGLERSLRVIAHRSSGDAARDVGSDSLAPAWTSTSVGSSRSSRTAPRS